MVSFNNIQPPFWRMNWFLLNFYWIQPPKWRPNGSKCSYKLNWKIEKSIWPSKWRSNSTIGSRSNLTPYWCHIRVAPQNFCHSLRNNFEREIVLCAPLPPFVQNSQSCPVFFFCLINFCNNFVCCSLNKIIKRICLRFLYFFNVIQLKIIHVG